MQGVGGSGGLGITVPTFTPLTGGLNMPDLGSAENSLFGSSNLGDGSNQVMAPQFADLEGPSSLQGSGAGILTSQLGAPLHAGVVDDKRLHQLDMDDEEQFDED